MDDFQIVYDHNTERTGLIELAEPITTALVSTGSKLCQSAGLNSITVTVRVTDDFRNEVEAYHSSRYPNYTTKRAGGEVGAITLSKDKPENNPLVLLNSSLFDIGSFLGIASFAIMLGHEVSHCIIGQARSQFGFPIGYCERPENLIESISYTALSVCDEFLADSLANKLLPNIRQSECTESEDTQESIQNSYANTRIHKMYDDLSTYVYPTWKDAVQKYRLRKTSLDEMTTPLVTAVQEGLILSAHYKAAVAIMKDNMIEIKKIEQHPAMKLYFAPFWNGVEPILNLLIESQRFDKFHKMDQESFDAASAAIEDIWDSLGVAFDLLPSGQVYVHVYEPIQADGNHS